MSKLVGKVIVLFVLAVLTTSLTLRKEQHLTITNFKCNPPRVVNINGCDCPADARGTQLIWHPSDSTCQCPSWNPLWSNGVCLKCPIGSTYNPAKQTCDICSQGLHYDIISKTCVPGI